MKNLDYIAIGNRIRSTRKNIGLSQEELAEECGLSVSFMGHIERGSRKMSLETLVVLCEALNVSADYLLMDDMPENDMVLQDILCEVKKKGSFHYSKLITIIKALAEIIEKI
jgi:transcriptional regulator with XRE-family HTH domain